MVKPDFLYNQGMRVLVYSEKTAAETAVGWHRDGTGIVYYRNAVQRKGGFNYYTLTFSLACKCTLFIAQPVDDSDRVFVASDYPYTYTDLMRFGTRTCTAGNKNRIRGTTLCKTLAGNPCPLYIITNFASPPAEIARRPAVIFTARVHPGYFSFATA